MRTKGLFYGSTTGNTQNAAQMIAKKMEIDASDVYDVSSASSETLAKYDFLLLGSSTWGYGDLQDDWDSFLALLTKSNLTGKKVAVFGTGDSQSYSDTFCDAFGLIAEAATHAVATLIGSVAT